MRSSRLPIRYFLVVSLLLAPLTAFADQKDDIYNAANAAYNNGKAVEANEGYCRVAAMDSGYKDAAAKCENTKKDAQTVINQHNKRYLDALQAVQEGRLDDAEKLLRMVKYGPRVSDAENRLSVVADLKAKKAQADAAAQQAKNADAAAKQRLDQGVSAFNAGDFNSAKNFLNQAGPAGQSYLSRIAQYEAKMAEGQRLVGEKNFAGAIAAFGVAAGISPNGPGDPNGQMARAQQLMASGTATPATTTTATKATAVRDEVKKVDVQANLDAADKAIAKKDYARARRLYNDILAQDFRNAEARAGLEKLPQDQASTGSSGEDDPLLASAIGQFYRGDFDTAQGALSYYIGAGKKRGLANFYLGVIYMTQYYLGGEKEPSKLQQAKQKFKTAKDVQGFVPPEKYISPKIMKVYQEAAGS